MNASSEQQFVDKVEEEEEDGEGHDDGELDEGAMKTVVGGI